MATTCPRCQGSGQVISDPCKKCGGDGRTKKKVDLSVKIPAGIDDGQRLKLSGEGDSGYFNGPSGNLYVVINVKNHEIFHREEYDVYCAIPVSFSQVALGADIEVPTLKGKASVNIPAGTQSGQKMRLKGKGIPKLGEYGNGDQIIEVQVETPTKLSAEQKDLLKKLSEHEHQSNPMAKKFFEKVKDLF
jgi:molecular chaperone DnaJ